MEPNSIKMSENRQKTNEQTETANVEDKSTWAIGGGVLAGIGLGFIFQYISPMAIPGFLMLGLGVGLMVTSIISRN
jgi:hypothetical protein